MKNMVELRDDLANLYGQLKDNEIAPDKASQLINCAGKIIGTVKVEIEYAEVRKELPQMEFMEKES